MTETAQRPGMTAGLLADIGEDYVRVGVMAPSEGRQRLVLDSRAGANGADPTAGLGEALRTLERLSGWCMVDRSAAPPLVAAVATLTLPTVLIAGTVDGLRALRERAAQLPDLDVSLELILDTRGRAPSGAGAAARALDGCTLEVILASLRSRQEAELLSALLRAVRIKTPAGRALLLFSGPTEVATTLNNDLTSAAQLITAGTVDWGHSGFDLAAARTAVAERVRQRLEPLRARTGTRGPLETRPTALEAAACTLQTTAQANTCLLDLGGPETHIVVAHDQALERRNGGDQSVLTGHTRLGTGEGFSRVLDAISPSALLRWLPFDLPPEGLMDYLGNRALRREPRAGDVQGLLIDQAVARECAIATRNPQWTVVPELVAVTGPAAAYPRFGQTALVLLDALQPAGPCRLLADASGILARVGALAPHDTQAGLSLLKSDTLVDLGPCLSLMGRATDGETVGEIEVEILSVEGTAERTTFDVRFGSLMLIPLRPGQVSSLRVTTSRRVSFRLQESDGYWARGQVDGGEEGDGQTVEGGILGLVVDARGRPMVLSADDLIRQAHLMEWLQVMDAVDAEVLSGLD